MEWLRDILVSTLGNLVWVGFVFVVLWVRDRRKKEQIAFCLGAYLTFLLRSTALLRNIIYPYVYLVELRTSQGTILPTLLDEISQFCTGVLNQSQTALSLTEARNLQESILRLYNKVILFQTHVSESQVATNVIVGNPVELVEPPRQGEEMRLFLAFGKDFLMLVRDILAAFPAQIRQNIPEEILRLAEQSVPLQERYEKQENH